MRSNTTSRLLPSWFSPPRGNLSSSMCDQWSIHWEPFLPRKVTKVTNKPSITLVEPWLERNIATTWSKRNVLPSVRCPKEAALFDGAGYLCRIKDQSSTTSYDQTFRLNGRLTKWA